MHFKVVLWSKFHFPVSLQLLKIEVINTYHAKFYIEIPKGRLVILIVKFSSPCRHYSIQKLAVNHMESWIQLREEACDVIHSRQHGALSKADLSETSHFFLSQWLKVHLNCADVFVNIREKSPCDCLDIYDFELCSKGAISLNKSCCFAHRTEAPRTWSWRLRGKFKRKNCLTMLPSWCLPFEDKSRNWAKRLSEDNRKEIVFVNVHEASKWPCVFLQILVSSLYMTFCLSSVHYVHVMYM